MKLEILSQGAFSHLRVLLEQNEKFVSEAGKMIRMSANILNDVTTKSSGQGGILSGLKRLFSGDTFFLSTYTAQNGQGEVVLAPNMLGEVFVMDLDGSEKWMCAGGSFMACGPDIAVETKFQGVKGLFSGESLFFLEASGTGPLVVNAFGAVSEKEIDGSYIVDSGHVVAFSPSLDYEITKGGGSWIQSFLAGEGVVMKFKGKGTLVLQSHNPTEFGKSVGGKLPPRG